MSVLDRRGRATERSLSKIVIDDLRRGDLHRTLLREMRDTYRFYLDEDRRAELERMGRLRRSVSIALGLLRALLLELSPARRVALLVSFVFVMIDPPAFSVWEWLRLDANLRPWGYLLLLFVLILELKDKLLARDEIEVARQVQRALLPVDPPTAAGWSIWGYTRPANDVGGDLLDYLRAGSGRIGIAVGDVAGKGLGAALLMAKLQATLRAVVPEDGVLDALGSRLNGILLQDGLINRYATLFYAEVEPGRGGVRYLNAGHNPPLVVRRSSIESLPASSYPLGMLDSAHYSAGRLELQPGELLVIYSDGLTEARNVEGQEFGVERLTAQLPGLLGLEVEAAGKRILAAVDGFLGDQRLDDDLSLVVVLHQGGAGSIP